MSPPSPAHRATLRWGGMIAALLVAQSVVLAGLFWWLANADQIRSIEAGFQADCRAFAAMAPAERRGELREAIARDIHRDRFLALFDREGHLVEGNVARLPDGAPAARSAVLQISPTQLPGKSSDTARLVACPLPAGERLLTGVDLDDTEQALRTIERALLIALAPALLLAVGAGLFAGRRAAGQVEAVRALTRRVAGGDLRERLPVPANPDSFGLLCAQINAMLDRLQTLVGEVRGVGDDIAHQLRTPLTRLRARVERAMGEASDAAAFRTAATQALDEIDKLLGIVSALLRIRELEDHARKSRFERVDLARLVEDACELHRPGVEDRGITLRCDVATAASVEGDPSLLIEAVSNLLDNAMKFGPADGEVSLTLADHAQRTIITVADQGAGVPPEERSLVIQRFYRGRHDCDGAGLGLSLVKAIADLHGAELQFAESGSAVSLVF